MRGAEPAALMAALALLASPAPARAAGVSRLALVLPAGLDQQDDGRPKGALPVETSGDAQVGDSSGLPEQGSDPPAPAEAISQDEPSPNAWKTINWVIATHDNGDMPFMVIDKVAAEVFLYDSAGEKIAAAPALVGMTEGDESTPGVGDRELSNIPPKDRKTPAGRFVAKFGRAAGGSDVLWIDYSAAISLHPVVTIRNQHRVERLKSPTPDDNRITYGCINVPAAFYAKIVKPLFKQSPGIVYVLPETKPLNQVFLAMPGDPQAPGIEKAE